MGEPASQFVSARWEGLNMQQRAAVFLDRDGTINVEKNYLYRVEDWEWLPGAVEAISALNRAGFLVVVVTNQAGVARAKYTEQDVEALHRFVDAEISHLGGRIDAYYYCPHHPDHGIERACDCRKPQPGMMRRAAQDLAIDLSRSYVIGDKISDVEAGVASGVTPLFVLTGHGRAQMHDVPAGVGVYPDLLTAVEVVLATLSGVHESIV
jgi:D-glycero-D-manno-heptose 1,7-bisphosphate phosphatase